MIENETIQRKELPALRFTLVLSFLVSILYQVFSTYVFHNFTLRGFFDDLLITIFEGWLFVFLIFYFIRINDRFAVFFKKFRYVFECAFLMISGFYLLYLAHCLKTGTRLPVSELLKNGSYRLYVCLNIVNVIFLYIIITVFRFYQQMLDNINKAEQMQKEYAGIRLQALKSQVNPHFLFNSLSVLSSLVHANAGLSEKFIIQLSKAYRYILEQKDARLISLKEELDFLDAYFFLIQIRFNKKVQLKKNIKIEPADFFLPPLSLQLLVENAIKHNSMSMNHPLQIHIEAVNDLLSVSNTLNKRDDLTNSTGLGLENIRKRLAFITNEPMRIRETDNLFLVTIPLIKKDKYLLYESGNN
ncbi:MAG: histidine kinase [Ginsengibacter sp.]